MINNEDKRFIKKSNFIVLASSVVGFVLGVSSKIFKSENSLDKDSKFYNSPIGSGISDSALNKMEEDYYFKYEQSKQNKTRRSDEKPKTKTNIEKVKPADSFYKKTNYAPKDTYRNK